MNIPVPSPEKGNYYAVMAQRVLHACGLEITNKCQCGSFSMRSEFTGCVRTFKSIEALSFLSALAIGGGAFKQLVQCGWNEKDTSKIPYAMFEEAVALQLSMIPDEQCDESGGGEGNGEDEEDWYPPFSVN